MAQTNPSNSLATAVSVFTHCRCFVFQLRTPCGAYSPLHNRGSLFVGGPIHVLPYELAEVDANYPHTPDVTRALIAQKGWKTVVGFQTRNPIHRTHEYIQKCALENVDGLLVHPLVGPTKADDSWHIYRCDVICRAARGDPPCAGEKELWMYTRYRGKRPCILLQRVQGHGYL